jgi:hypothetical protein
LVVEKKKRKGRGWMVGRSRAWRGEQMGWKSVAGSKGEAG